MTREGVTDRLIEIFSAILQVTIGDIDPTLSPDTCDLWDSLQHLHLMSAIDETFSVHLDIEQQVEILTFDLAIDVVCEVLDNQGRLDDAVTGKG